MSESLAKGEMWLPRHYSAAVVPQLPEDTGSPFDPIIIILIMGPCPAAAAPFLKQQES